MSYQKFKWNQALVVSTHPVQRGALEFHLAKAGFMVTVTADVNQAFHLAEKQYFDLIVADLKAEGGSGIDLARQLRQLDPYDATPMVLLADQHAELDLDYLRGNLWLLVVREPCNIADLVAKLSRNFSPQQAFC
jgi:DNA-binding response OmpR family regulator